MKEIAGTQIAKEKLSTGSDEKTKSTASFLSVFTREASYNIITTNTKDSRMFI